MCPQEQGGRGAEPVQKFFGEGGGVNFSRFFTDVFYGWLLIAIIRVRFSVIQENVLKLDFKSKMRYFLLKTKISERWGSTPLAFDGWELCP